MNALVRDAIDTLRRHGLTPEIEQGSHLKVKFTNVLGSRCVLVVSCTPSCWRSLKASRAELRRLMRRPAR